MPYEQQQTIGPTNSYQNSVVKNQYFMKDDMQKIEIPKQSRVAELKFYPGTRIPIEKYELIRKLQELKGSRIPKPNAGSLKHQIQPVTESDVYAKRCIIAEEAMMKEKSQNSYYRRLLNTVKTTEDNLQLIKTNKLKRSKQSVNSEQ